MRALKVAACRDDNGAVPDLTEPEPSRAEADLPAYFRYERPEVVDAVPVGARRILEIGCAAGMTGAAIKRRQECHLIGVERDPAAAAEARGRLDAVIEGDVEAMELPFGPDSFDAIVCADVLEHLRRPEDLLVALAGMLAPGGTLVASIPNIANIAVIAEAAEGRFDYGDAGILDRTHLRFFTLGGFTSVLEEAGLRVTRCVTLHDSTPPDVSGAAGTVPSSLALGRVTLRNLRPAEVLERHASQLLFSATPASISGVAGKTAAAGRMGGATIVVRARDEAEALMGFLETVASGDPGAPYDLVIVDDASADATRLLEGSPDGSVKVVHREEAGSLSSAFNLAAASARRGVLVFADPACRPAEGWLRALADRLEVTAPDGPGVRSGQPPRPVQPVQPAQPARPVLGAVGPVLLSAGGQVLSAGMDVGPAPGGGFRVSVRAAGAAPADVESSGVSQVGALPGWLLAVRADAFHQVGGFDEGYFDGEEDIDLCLRLREAGWQVACEPSAKVVVPDRPRGSPEHAGANARRLGARWGEKAAKLPLPGAAGAPVTAIRGPASREPSGIEAAEGADRAELGELAELATRAASLVPEDAMSVLVVGSPVACDAFAACLRERGGARLSEVRLEGSDPQPADLAFSTGSFDAVVCPGSFEEVVDPWGLARSLAELLAPGGVLVTWAANTGNLRVLADLVEGKDLPRGLRHFTRATLVRMLRDAGLDPGRIVGIQDPEVPYDRDLPPNLVTTAMRGRLVVSGVLLARMEDLAASSFVAEASRPLAGLGARGGSGSQAAGGPAGLLPLRGAPGHGRPAGSMLAAASGLDASIVIRVHDEADRLAAFVGRLVTVEAGATFELVIADQGSRDGVAALRSSVEGNVNVVHLGSGVAEARAWNLAAAEARGRHLVFCDLGVALRDGWLRALVDRLDAESRLAAAVPLVVGPEGKVVSAGYSLAKTSEAPGETPSAFRAIARHSGAIPEAMEVLDPAHLDALCGSVLAIRRDAFESESGFDAMFVGDDAFTDLGLRLRSAGWKLGYEPAAQVTLYEAPRPPLAHRSNVSHRRLAERWDERSALSTT